MLRIEGKVKNRTRKHCQTIMFSRRFASTASLNPEAAKKVAQGLFAKANGTLSPLAAVVLIPTFLFKSDRSRHIRE